VFFPAEGDYGLRAAQTKGGGLASDYFLKLEGIKGESSDSKHKDEIEIVSFSWGVTQSGQIGVGGGGGSGKVQFNDLQVTSRVSKASPVLFLACATGQHLKEATLAVRKAGGDQVEYLKIKLTDVLVSSYQEAGGGEEDRPLDVVSFNFAKIEFSYFPQKPDGKLDSPVKAGYDLKQNKKV
jgi:type VI secretion system secreted protein Hcp